MNRDWGRPTLEWIQLIDRQDTLIVECKQKFSAMDPLDAALHTAQNISSTCPAPYHLLCSGGVDSQSMLYAWRLATRMQQSQVHSFLYNQRCNWPDVQNLPELCDHLGVPLTFHELDLLEFLESGDARAIQKQYRTTSPQMAAHIRMMETFHTGTVIMAGNFPHGLDSVALSLPHMGVVRYAKQRNAQSRASQVVPFFHIHDYTIGRCLHQHPLIWPENVPDHYDWISDTGYRQKCNLYHAAGFEIRPHQQDASGFQEFKQIYEARHPATSLERWQYGHKPSRWAFDIHHRYAAESLVNQPKRMLISNIWL